MIVIEVLTIPVLGTVQCMSILILSNSLYMYVLYVHVRIYMYILELNYIHVHIQSCSLHLLFSTSVCFFLLQQHWLTDAHHRKNLHSYVATYMYNICIYTCVHVVYTCIHVLIAGNVGGGELNLVNCK